MFKQTENRAGIKLTEKSSLFDMSNSIKERYVPEAGSVSVFRQSST